MSFTEPRLITHQLPLFDNSTDSDGAYRDRRDEVVEGAVRFRRNGVVILGSYGFGYTRPIVGHRFSGGCEANRDPSDQILCIRTPTGDVHRFRYVHRDANWYRLVVVERAPHRLMDGIHAVREEVADFGPVLGAVAGGGRVLVMVFWFLIPWSIRVFLLCLITHWTRRAVINGYGHLGPSMVDQITYLLWIAEAAVYCLGWLKFLAYTRGGRFYRVVLPIQSLVFLLATLFLALGGPVQLFRTLAAFRHLEVNQKNALHDNARSAASAEYITTDYTELEPKSLERGSFQVRP